MSGHWYDSIVSGAGAMVDMFTGAAPGSTEMGGRAAAGEVSHVAGNTDFGKATGLAPFMKMLGIGGETPPPDTRMAKPSELADLEAGRMPAVAGGSQRYGTDVRGKDESKGFQKLTNADGSSGGYQMPSYQKWDAAGRNYGNRQGDIDARDKNVTVAAPEIYQPDLSKLPKTIQEGVKSLSSFKAGTDPNTNSGYFHERAEGEHRDWDDAGKGWSAKTKFDPATGKGSTGISTGYQRGFEDKEGYRAYATSDDKRYSASAEAGTVVSGGYSGAIGLDTKNGLYATAGIGGKSGLYAQADANAKSESVKIGGQDYNAGIGVHGDTFFGAKAGASGTIGIGPEFVGAKGSIGAFAGAEAAADVHGNLGPLGGKLGASGMAGAGIGADGDISYKDGKFHMGGKLFAALGYGGSLSGDVTVDVGAIGRSLYGLGSDAVSGVSNLASSAATGLADTGSAIYNGVAGLFSGW